MQERDWYREHTAKKNGLYYNTRNATYSAARIWKPSTWRNAAPVVTRWHWSLTLVLFLTISAVVLAALSFISRFSH